MTPQLAQAREEAAEASFLDWAGVLWVLSVLVRKFDRRITRFE